MEFERLLEATILIVEDIPANLLDNENYIEEIDKNRREADGIARFTIENADSYEKAMEKLKANIHSPYNIVLLDLHLPEPDTRQSQTAGDETQEIQTKFSGLKILEFIAAKGAAEAVIVVSAFPEKLLEVFRKGASDFIGKPFEAEELQERVLICWSRLLLKKSKRIFDERIRDLVPYAEKGLAHRFTTCFSGLVRTVAHTSEDLERYMRERYGLDGRKDPSDLFFTSVNSQERSVAKYKREWEGLKAPLQSPDESSRSAAVETLLREIHHSLLPCLIVKKIRLEVIDDGTTEILTFESDVRAVLKEIILGAAGTLQDFKETRHVIKIKVGNADGQVKVSFTDRLKPIAAEDAIQINEGASISPERRFEREWGLSVVQHIAMRGGGRLEIKPQARGNVVTYLIPSAA